MDLLKCEVCGGKLIREEGNVFICESCGNKVLSESEGDFEAYQSELMSNANALLQKQSFDDAYLAFESILAKNPQNIEARWNLLLCRYGVQYEQDLLTKRMIPTISRMRYEAFVDDPDYQTILRNVGKAEQENYKNLGEEIQSIQVGYLKIVEKEQPYDVFISFKETGKNGERTRDYEIAYEIYDRLNEHGIRTFFSPVTLMNKAGQEYEPYIFSALYSSGVMVLVGTSEESINSPWVKNEWSRYLALMRTDSDKFLLPVYEEMEKEEFPPEIPIREAVNFKNDGAVLDLVHGILTLSGKGREVSADDDATRILQLTTEMRTAVETQKWEKAEQFADSILDIDAKNAEVHLYLLLTKFKVTEPTRLLEADASWIDSPYYNRALKYATSVQKQMLESIKVQYITRVEEERKHAAEISEQSRRKKETEDAMRRAVSLIREKRYVEAQNIITAQAFDHADSKKYLEKCRKGIIAEQELSNPHFLYNRLKKVHPDIFNEMTKRYRKKKSARGGFLDGEENFTIISGVVLMIEIVLVMLGIIPEMAGPIIASIIFLVILGRFGVFRFLNMFTGGFYIIGVVFVCGFPYAIAGQIGSYIAVMSFFAVIGGLCIFIGGISAWTEKKLMRLICEYREYMESTISPLEEQLWQEFKDTYSPYGLFFDRPRSIINSLEGTK